MTFKVHYQNNGELFILFIEANFSMQAAYSSPKPKGQVSFLIEIWPLSVIVVVVIVVVNFSHFHLWANFNQTWHKAFWEMITKYRKYMNDIKNLLLKDHRANFNKTLHKASWVKGIQVYSNEGPHPFSRGDKYEMAKIQWRNSEIFLRTTGPFSTKLVTKHLKFVWNGLIFFLFFLKGHTLSLG